MSYSKGKRPYDHASRSSHHHIINNIEFRENLKNYQVPPNDDSKLLNNAIQKVEYTSSPIEHIISIDGGFTEIPISNGYPAALLHFFQFGALCFKVEDLKNLQNKKHISPEDMQKLKEISRVELALGTRGTKRKDCLSLKDSFRKELYEFFVKNKLGEDNNLLDTLKWFVFKQYKKTEREDKDKVWFLSSNPNMEENENGLYLKESEMKSDGTFKFDDDTVYLTDIFRLHEIIDEFSGATGTVSYVAGIIEHILAIHIIKNLLNKSPAFLSKVLFIMDRPTGWFGQTAICQQLMFELINWLLAKHNIYLAGLEKSGAFVEYAMALQKRSLSNEKETTDDSASEDSASEDSDNSKEGFFPAQSILLLNDTIIYKYISAGKEDPKRPYASTSYYGHKVIFKSRLGRIHIVSVPVKELKKNPSIEDLPNLKTILGLIDFLHCDMYDNALLPVALVNKLVSLSAHPSSKILKNFANHTLP